RGDDILLIDHSPYHMLRAMRAIVEALRGSQFTCELRFGLDWGQVGFAIGANGEPAPSTGIPLRRAARLEPLARPGTVLMTDIAMRPLAAGGEGRRVAGVTESWRGGPRRLRRGWDISKRPGTEKDLVLPQLFLLEL